MSEEIVNQITLSYLISKNQLQKLNKKLNENTENNRKTDIVIHKDKIKTLFTELLEESEPEGLIQEVKNGFDFFIDKCIYYFKTVESCNNESSISNDKNFQEDVDEDEEGEDDDKDEEEGEGDEEGEEEEGDCDEEDLEEDIYVKPKYYKKPAISEGVENIQQLPLNWFQNIRQDYKKNKIIPRKREIIIADNSFSFEKKKI
jgi:hypothetical protein